MYLVMGQSPLFELQGNVEDGKKLPWAISSAETHD